MTTDKVVGDQMDKNKSLIERICLYIPGYRAYKQKNLRRDEDRAVRTEVARALETAKMDLATIQRATVGDLDLMRDTERIRTKTDKYYIDVKKAVNGYSALHDSVKIMESELDNLIEWDAKLMDDAVALKKETSTMVDSVDKGNTDIKKPLRDLERIIDQLLEDYNGREKIMKGFQEQE